MEREQRFEQAVIRQAVIAVMRGIARREDFGKVMEVLLKADREVLMEIADTCYEERAHLPDLSKVEKTPGERVSPAEFAEYIRGSYGHIATIAQRAGMTPWAVRLYLKRHPELKEYVEDEYRQVCDLALGVAIEALRKGDTQMARHILASPRAAYLQLQGRDTNERRDDFTIHVVYERPRELPQGEVVETDFKELEGEEDA